MQPDRNRYKDLLVIVTGFCIIGLIIVRRSEGDLGWYFIVGALGLGVIGIFSETVTRYITTGWHHFGMFLGKVNSTILLGVLFFLMLTPIALLKRLTTGKKDDPSSSNWSEADATTMDFEKMW